MVQVLSVDEAAEVRSAAARALADVAEPGNAEALGALCEALGDDSVEVGCAALESLGALATGGGSQSDRALERMAAAAHTNAASTPTLRKTALAALLRALGMPGGQTSQSLPILEATLACVGDEEPSVAEAALRLLPLAAPANPEEASNSATAALYGGCAPAAAKAPRVRCAALAAHGTLAPRGDDGAIEAAAAFLEEGNSEVRAAALDAVARIANVGDAHAISLALARVEQTAGGVGARETSSDVRKAALEALGRLAPRGHERALRSAVQGLKDTDVQLRKAARATIEALAPEEVDEELIAALAELLAHSDSQVRTTAIDALQSVRIGEEGKQRVVREICLRMHDRNRDVRRDMRKAALKLAGRGCPFVVLSLCDGLRPSEHEETKLDAARALPSLAEERDKDACDALARAADIDPSAKVRFTALQILAHMGKGRKASVRAAARALMSLEVGVREQALATLQAVLGNNGDYATDLLVEQLPLVNLEHNQRMGPRLHILQAIELAGVGTEDEDAIAALAERLEDRDSGVRVAALSALEKVAGRGGNEIALRGVAALFTCKCNETRKKAALHYRFLAHPWDHKAARIALEATAAEWWEHRLAALHALAAVVDPGSGPEGEPYREPPEDVMARLEELSQRETHHPVKTVATAILQKVRKREAIPMSGYGTMMVVPMSDSKRFLPREVREKMERKEEEARKARQQQQET